MTKRRKPSKPMTRLERKRSDIDRMTGQRDAIMGRGDLEHDARRLDERLLDAKRDLVRLEGDEKRRRARLQAVRNRGRGYDGLQRLVDRERSEFLDWHLRIGLVLRDQVEIIERGGKSAGWDITAMTGMGQRCPTDRWQRPPAGRVDKDGKRIDVDLPPTFKPRRRNTVRPSGDGGVAEQAAKIASARATLLWFWEGAGIDPKGELGRAVWKVLIGGKGVYSMAAEMSGRRIENQRLIREALLRGLEFVGSEMDISS